MQNDDDPTPNVCHTSSSQLQQLNNCHFGMEESSSSDPVVSPVESTEIFMESPPETPSSQDEVFRTPPQESTLSTPHQFDDQTFGVDGGDTMAIDCEEDGRDTELGFVGMDELTESIERGESSEEDGLNHELCESASKRLKLVDEREESCTEGEKVSVEKVETPKEMDGEVSCVERIAKSLTKLNSPLKMFGIMAAESGSGVVRGSVDDERDESCNTRTSVEKLNSEKNACSGGPDTQEVVRNETIAAQDLDGGLESQQACMSVEIENIVGEGDKEISQETPARRKLEFSKDVIESDDGETNADNRVEGTSNGEEVSNANELCNPIERKLLVKSVDDIERFRYVSRGNMNSNSNDKDLQGKRMLPASILENAGEVDKKTHHDQDTASITEDAPSICENSKDGYDSWEFLKDVLKMISCRSKSSCDSNLQNMNIFEALKMRGMTFPEPNS